MPILVLEGDIIDKRLFSEAGTKVKIDTFVETVGAHKKRKTKN